HKNTRNDYVQAEDNTCNIFDINEEFEQAEEAYTQAEEKFEKAKDTYDRTHQKRRDRFREQ
ncbi:618_t:CDS:1, partial [Rhizophagus irregularis]